MALQLSKECSECSTLNLLYNIEALTRNRCRYCENILDNNLEGVNVDEIIRIAYNKSIPVEIPFNCSDCKYFQKTGIIDANKGRCNLYDEVTYADSWCIVTKAENVLKEFHRVKILPNCPKCGAEQQNREGQFCIKCGSEIYPKEYVKVANCDKCDENYPVENKFCEIDGNELKIIEVEKGTAYNVSGYTPKKNQEVDNNPIPNLAELVAQKDDSEKQNAELGFGWGNFWIGVGFFYGALMLIFFVFLGYETEEMPNPAIALIVSGLAIGSAYGIMQRKQYGLYLVFGTIILNYGLGGAMYLSGDEPGDVFRGLALIVIGMLWWIYFGKRKEMFS